MLAGIRCPSQFLIALDYPVVRNVVVSTEYVAHPLVNTVALRDISLAFHRIFLLGSRLLVLLKPLILCRMVVQAGFALELLSAVRTLIHDESFSVQGLVAL